MSYSALVQGALGRRRRPGARLAALLAAGTLLAFSGLALVAPAQAAVTGVDLQAKVTGPAAAVPGTTFTDSILITNAGTDPATGVELDLAAPATGVTYTITDPTVSCDPGWHCTMADLAGSAQKAVALQVTTASPLADGDSVTVQATVLTTATDVNHTNDVSSAATPLSNRGQLSVAIQRTSASPMLPGTRATYKVTLKNNGPSTSLAPVVEIGPQDNSTKLAATASNGGVCHVFQKDTYASCTWSSLPAGSTRTVSFAATSSSSLQRGSSYLVDVFANATNGTGLASAESVTPVIDSTTRPVDVSVTTYMTPQVKAGERGHWKVTVTNHGPYRAHNVVLTAVLPPGMHWVQMSGHKATGNTTRLNDMESGVSYIDEGWFSMSVGGHMSMQLKVTHTDPDSKPSNNASKSVSRIIGPVVTVTTLHHASSTTTSSSTPVVHTTSSVSSPTNVSSTGTTSVSAGDSTGASAPSSTSTSSTGQKQLADTGGPERQLPLVGLALLLAGGVLLLVTRERRRAPRHGAWVSSDS